MTDTDRDALIERVTAIAHADNLMPYGDIGVNVSDLRSLLAIATSVRLASPSPSQTAPATNCDWPALGVFRFADEPGEHDPCYVVMPDGASLAVNHHAGPGVDIARAKFIVDACNAALFRSPETEPGGLDADTAISLLDDHEAALTAPEDERVKGLVECLRLTDQNLDYLIMGADISRASASHKEALVKWRDQVLSALASYRGGA